MDGWMGWDGYHIGHRSSRATSVLIRRKSVKAISNISKNLDDSTIKKSSVNFMPKGL